MTSWADLIDALPKTAPPTTARKPRFKSGEWAESYGRPSEGIEAEIKRRQNKERLDHYDQRRAMREAYEAEDKVKDEEAEEEAKRGARKRKTLAEATAMAERLLGDDLTFKIEVRRAVAVAKRLLQQKKNTTLAKKDKRKLKILRHLITIILTQEKYAGLVDTLPKKERESLKKLIQEHKLMRRTPASMIIDPFFRLAPEETFELRF